ncbi:MAG: cupin domain-containing protein [Candidatus Sumerlaeaceae bacterium]|nr:cupin domain-containing protein [Candidatus Sumerlaeaceae bacterium]
MTSPAPNAIFTQAELSNSHWYMGHLMSILVDGGDTGGAYTFTTNIQRKGFEPPPHIHSKEHELFYHFDGEFEYSGGKDKFHAKAGSTVFLPKDVAHQFQILSDQSRMIILLTPSGFDQFFLAHSRPAEHLDTPPDPSEPVNIPQMIQMATEFGCSFLQPGQVPADVAMPGGALKPVHQAAGAGEKLKVVGMEMTVKINGDDSGGAFTFVEVVLPPGTGAPFHSLGLRDEAIYVLEGELTVRAGDETRTVSSHKLAYMPRGVPFGYFNNGLSNVKMLLLITPGHFEEFFREIASAVAPTPGQIGEISAKHGVTILGPPPIT